MSIKSRRMKKGVKGFDEAVDLEGGWKSRVGG